MPINFNLLKWKYLAKNIVFFKMSGNKIIYQTFNSTVDIKLYKNKIQEQSKGDNVIVCVCEWSETGRSVKREYEKSIIHSISNPK